jgi:hypothetical protein
VRRLSTKVACQFAAELLAGEGPWEPSLRPHTALFQSGKVSCSRTPIACQFGPRARPTGIGAQSTCGAVSRLMIVAMSILARRAACGRLRGVVRKPGGKWMRPLGPRLGPPLITELITKQDQYISLIDWRKE